MKKTLILVEGIADLVFLKDFADVHFNYKYNETGKFDDKTENIIMEKNNGDILKLFIIRSKTAFENPNTITLIQADINKENYNNKILILDADDDFAGTKQQAVNYQNNPLGLTDNYIFPNNAATGDLEKILENIQVDKTITGCWTTFEACINAVGGDYTIPARKSKIHTYLEILNPDTKTGKESCKERNRNYKDKTKWNLHDSTIPEIGILKTFLDQYLQ